MKILIEDIINKDIGNVEFCYMAKVGESPEMLNNPPRMFLTSIEAKHYFRMLVESNNQFIINDSIQRSTLDYSVIHSFPKIKDLLQISKEFLSEKHNFINFLREMEKLEPEKIVISFIEKQKN